MIFAFCCAGRCGLGAGGAALAAAAAFVDCKYLLLITYALPEAAQGMRSDGSVWRAPGRMHVMCCRMDLCGWYLDMICGPQGLRIGKALP